MEKRLSNNIKIFSFLMTCCMVLYHTDQIDSTHAVGTADGVINTFLNGLFSTNGGLAMCFFFTVTGFLLFNGLSFKTYLSKIKRRVFSLLIPYVVWQCLIGIMTTIRGHYDLGFIGFFIKIFGLVDWPFNPAMWYVYAVFLLALLSPVLLVILKNKKIGFGIIIGIIILVELITREIISNDITKAILSYSYIEHTLWYLPSYLVGAFYGKFYAEGHLAEDLKYCFVFIITAYICDVSLSGFFSSTVWKMLPIIGLLVLPEMPKLNNKSIYKLSFLMYALHMPVIGFFQKRIDSFFMNLTLSVSLINISEHLIILGIDIGLAFLIWFVLKRICPKLLGVLSGGRSV